MDVFSFLSAIIAIVIAILFAYFSQKRQANIDRRRKRETVTSKNVPAHENGTTEHIESSSDKTRQNILPNIDEKLTTSESPVDGITPHEDAYDDSESPLIQEDKNFVSNKTLVLQSSSNMSYNDGNSKGQVNNIYSMSPINGQVGKYIRYTKCDNPTFPSKDYSSVQELAGDIVHNVLSEAMKIIFTNSEHSVHTYNDSLETVTNSVAQKHLTNALDVRANFSSPSGDDTKEDDKYGTTRHSKDKHVDLVEEPVHPLSRNYSAALGHSSTLNGLDVTPDHTQPKNEEPVVKFYVSQESLEPLMDETNTGIVPDNKTQNNSNGNEYLSLLSPKPERDDDDASSIGYSDTEVEPSQASRRFPELHIEAMMKEEHVSMRAVKLGSEILNEHRILFLNGFPGSGKTTTAANIIKMNIGQTMSNGKPCRYRIVTHFRDFQYEPDTEEFQIILFDNCFGSIDFKHEADCDAVEAFLGQVMRIRMRDESIAYIFTIDSSVWDKLLGKYTRVLLHLAYTVIDLSEGAMAPNENEKEGILRLRLSKTKSTVVDYFKDENLHPVEGNPVIVSEKTISTIMRTECKDDVGFPELCTIMCMNINRVRGIHDIGIFRFPRTLLFSHFQDMSKSINHDDRMGLCILIYAAVKHGCFDKYNISIDLMDRITESVVKGKLDLRSGLRSLRNGILVKLSRSKYIIQHKLISDVLLEYVDQNNILV